ncbi:MAG TPA: DUF6504 family protein [Nocardioidaceae bacterium]|nr:DUF6504 family protein [Nocardioidaceae bacterium]
MRRYDDPVDVRKGMVDGSEGPEQFLWRGRLWKVHSVLAHWVETGAWWDSAGAHAVLGTEAAAAGADRGADHELGGGRALTVLPTLPDMVAEREIWRVEASRGRLSAEGGGGGVFDLLFDWAEGSWRLARCLD